MAARRHRLFFRAASRRGSSRASVLAAGPVSTCGRRGGLGGGCWMGARGKSRSLVVEEDTTVVAGARGNGGRSNSWRGRCRRGWTEGRQRGEGDRGQGGWGSWKMTGALGANPSPQRAWMGWPNNSYYFLGYFSSSYILLIQTVIS
jgi:hypothetical protein